MIDRITEQPFCQTRVMRMWRLIKREIKLETKIKIAIMAQIHDDFEKAILQCRFKKDYNKGYDYQMYDGTWFYKLNFEGYAYVLYKEINIYVKPLMSLFKIYNKFAKGTAQIGLHYAVPIAHFREPQKLIDIIAILTDKLDEND